MKNKFILAGIPALIFIVGFMVWLWWDPFHRVKGPAVTPIPTPVAQQLKVAPKNYPQLLLSFKGDEHRLTLRLEKIPAVIKKGEYDFTYLAHDSQGQEFEKGQYDNFDISGATLEREILLGTSSCTTGTCRYRYDKNVSGGKISFTFSDTKGNILPLTAPFWFVRPGKTITVAGHQVVNKGRNICLFYQDLRPSDGHKIYRFSCLPGGQLLVPQAQHLVNSQWQPFKTPLAKGIVSWEGK